MTRKAKQYNAINLSQGYPDYPPHESVLKAAQEAVGAGHNQYSFTWGLGELREALSRKLSDFNNVAYDPIGEITITCGASEAIMATVLALVETGDEVLVFQPFYENYLPAISMASGKPIFTDISLEKEIDHEDIEKKVGKNTKAIILNTPHNPTGKVFTRKELEFIRDLCMKHDILLITDEMYERMVYEGEHVSPASIDGMWERTVTIGGFSKIYGVTGWRVGYVAAPKELMQLIRKTHDFLTVCAPTPFQKAAVQALQLPQQYYTDMCEYYKRGRDMIFEALQQTKLRPSLPDGAYYMMAGIEEYGMDDMAFADWLVEKKRVAVVPGSSFYRQGGEKLVRFCFSQKPEHIREAMERITK
jgi:aminotransferase